MQRVGSASPLIAAPNHDPNELLGHVTVFKDPGLPGAIKSHRIIAVNPDGTMTRTMTRTATSPATAGRTRRPTG